MDAKLQFLAWYPPPTEVLVRLSTSAVLVALCLFSSSAHASVSDILLKLGRWSCNAAVSGLGAGGPRSLWSVTPAGRTWVSDDKGRFSQSSEVVGPYGNVRFELKPANVEQETPPSFDIHFTTLASQDLRGRQPSRVLTGLQMQVLTKLIDGVQFSVTPHTVPVVTKTTLVYQWRNLAQTGDRPYLERSRLLIGFALGEISFSQLHVRIVEFDVAEALRKEREALAQIREILNELTTRFSYTQPGVVRQISEEIEIVLSAHARTFNSAVNFKPPSQDPSQALSYFEAQARQLEADIRAYTAAKIEDLKF